MDNHVPWRVSDDGPDVDGKKLVLEDMNVRMLKHHVVEEVQAEPSHRRVQIRRGDLETYGFTADCNGCSAI